MDTKKPFDEEGILLTGCARSGTSMTAGCFSLCGAFGGKTSGATPYNRKGMYENERIRNELIKPYLSSMDVDPLGQNPLPDIQKLAEFPNFGQKVHRILLEEGYKAGKWYYKGAKMCLIWPIVHSAFPKSKWIIVRRSDGDVVNSCLKTGFMRAYNTKSGWRYWINQHKRRFREMHQTIISVFEVWPSRFIKGDYGELKEAIEWVGLKFNEGEIKNFISPELWSENSEVKNGNKS